MKTGITVDTLLKLPIFKSNGHLAANTGLNNVIQYVTVMEAPDFHFSNLGDNVFVLTTLSTHHDSLEEINRVIRGLCEVRVSAIAVKLGRFINEIDPSTIQIALEYQVPLITLQPTVYFREILSDTLSMIADNQRLILNQINQVNQSLINAILQNCTTKDLLDLLCEHLECYCCCINESGKIIGESSSLKTGIDTSHVRRVIDQYVTTISQESSQSHYRDGDTVVFPCIVDSRRVAIFCIVANEEQLELVYSLAQSIVSGISIKFLEQNLKIQAEMELTASILDDILFSQKSDAKAIAERLELLNFTPHTRHLIIILSPAGFDYTDQHYLSTIENFQKIFVGKFESSLVFKRGNEYIVLVSYSTPNITANLKSILDYCQNAISRTESNRYDIGCSIPVSDLSSMRECYGQAKRAIQFGRMADRERHVFMYENYFELGLISCGADSSDAGTMFRRIITPIIEYDKKFKTDLWSTLEASFRYDNLDTTASRLFIHISTLRYRLNKVETLTGYSYFKIHDRLTLYLAYLLFKVSANLER